MGILSFAVSCTLLLGIVNDMATVVLRPLHNLLTGGCAAPEATEETHTAGLFYGGYMQCQTETPSGEMPTHVLHE